VSRIDRVVLLIGGVGGAKLAVGLAALLPPERLTIVVNTGDDFEHLGLRISPDLDTVLNNLAGVANPQTGWGLAGDTFHAMETIGKHGGPAWFQLGDRDLGVNLLRTEMLRVGWPLSQVTRHLAATLGVRHPVIPMSDDAMRTWVDTDQGEMAFQEYFVRERWQPVVKRIIFKNAATARPAPGVLSALESADLIIIGPSNPYLSIDPILAVPGIREAMVQSAAFCVAVSPIVGGQALKGPAAKLMSELGIEVSPRGVAVHYDGIVDGIIIDSVDQSQCADLESLGLRAAALDTIMNTLSDKTRLAHDLLSWAKEHK